MVALTAPPIPQTRVARQRKKGPIVTGVVLAAAGGSSAALQPRGHGANHIMVLAAAKATPILGHSS